MAVSLKTTLGYHSAEASKQSLLGLAECNTPPQNANHLSSWASKQAKHELLIAFLPESLYTSCSGTTLNTYGTATIRYSDGTSERKTNQLISSSPNSPDCGYLPKKTIYLTFVNRRQSGINVTFQYNDFNKVLYVGALGQNQLSFEIEDRASENTFSFLITTDMPTNVTVPACCSLTKHSNTKYTVLVNKIQGMYEQFEINFI
mgnify:CR=1 FL=1